MYAIVEFTETKEVEVVPDNWITPMKDSCWWPNFKSSTKIIKSVTCRHEVDSSTFKLYNIRVMKYFGQYEDARKKLVQAEEDSDLNSEAESTPKSRRMSKFPKRIVQENDSDYEDSLPSHHLALANADNVNVMPRLPSRVFETDNSNNWNMLPPPPPSHFVGLTNDNNGNTMSSPSSSHSLGFTDSKSGNKLPPLLPSPSRNILAMGSGSVHQQHSVGVSAASASNLNPDGDGFSNTTGEESHKSGFENWMVRQVGIMKAQLKNLQESVDVLVGARNTENLAKRQKLNDPAANNILKLLPVVSMEAVDQFLEAVVEAEIKNAVVEKLSLRGGNDIKDCTCRILAALLTDCVAVNFSWLGSRGGKRSFSGCLLKSIVYDAVRNTRKMHDSPDDQIEDVIKTWLKNSKKRITSKKPCSSGDACSNGETGNDSEPSGAGAAEIQDDD